MYCRMQCTAPQLIFDDAAIHLRVGVIWVNGALRMGSQNCRTSAPITITFVVAPGKVILSYITVLISNSVGAHMIYHLDLGPPAL